ncbi:MAG TPA: hypothetical protein VG895_01455 [Patescibacteria group bacterium]|nr:hypothetical protein [Patescibacteria group bacterium]
MRKEILFAIIAGGAFGLLIAFGAWKANAILKSKSTPSSSSTPLASNIPTATSSTNQEFKIVLQNLVNNQLATDTPIAISGTTNPNTWVVISGEDGDSIIDASTSGGFSANTDLEGGVNQIIVSGFDENGNEADANLNLVFSSQFQKDPTQQGEALSYVGTITDITNSVIQIKNDAGDIEQINPTASANFIDTRNNDTKIIKQTDVAIGDYLIAMGYKDANNILQATRVVVSDAVIKTDRVAFYGIVIDTETGTVTVKNPNSNTTVTVTPNTDATIAGDDTFSQIKTGDKIIAAGEFKEGNIDARSIQVLK